MGFRILVSEIARFDGIILVKRFELVGTVGISLHDNCFV